MNQRATQLHQWFTTPLGQQLLRAESQKLQPILPHLFGYHLLQIGDVGDGQLLESSRIMHRYLLIQSTPAPALPYSTLCSTADSLPIASDSIDVVLLAHSLEFEDNPHEVLREVERILIPQGHLIIIGFNPYSLWTIWRWINAQRAILPWQGHLISLLRLKDWLALLGFNLKEYCTFFYMPPFNSPWIMRHVQILDWIGERAAWHFGAVYIVVAQKRVTALTPIRPKWRHKPVLIPNAISTPRRKHRVIL